MRSTLCLRSPEGPGSPRRVRPRANTSTIRGGSGCSSANGKKIEEGAAQAEGGGAEKVRGGANFPQPRTQHRGSADDEIADEIIRTDQLPASLGRAVTDDGSFAGRVAELLQSANRKSHDQHG